MALVWQTLFQVPTSTRQPGVITTPSIAIPATADWLRITFDIAENDRTDPSLACDYRYEISTDGGLLWFEGPLLSWVGSDAETKIIDGVALIGIYPIYTWGMQPGWAGGEIRGYFDILARVRAGFLLEWAEPDIG